MALSADRVRVLVEVAHAGSIAAAAARMGFTPSALSQQLANWSARSAPRWSSAGADTRLTQPGQVLLEHDDMRPRLSIRCEHLDSGRAKAA